MQRNRDPKGGDRDVFNERPTIDEQRVALTVVPEKKRLSATSCTIHFNMGDVFFKLYPDVAPKTVSSIFKCVEEYETCRGLVRMSRRRMS